MPYTSRHLAVGLGGIGQSIIGRGVRPVRPCDMCGRMRAVSNTTNNKPVSFCSDCRTQEPELTSKWRGGDDAPD